MSQSSNIPLPLPGSPKDGDRLNAAHPNAETLHLLSHRRSTVVKDMREPGPSEEEVGKLLTLAARVPDHGKIGPWRFLVFRDSARARFGERLAKIFTQKEPAADETRIDFERERFLRAPLVIGVISSPVPHPKAPHWEQIMSAGAVCQNLLIAANAMGYAAQWLTEWYGFDDDVAKILGLSESEKVAGFIYIGSTDCQPLERRRPSLTTRVQFWTDPKSD
ncbi:MAG: nitroreductase [Alphaproteobacteria bacterium]|nr:MAG: nitroreductase [Alphaproteobacteria bacterium]